jgi:hypothetical protein
MPKINLDAFFDGFTGAGLFGKLGRPAGKAGRVADDRYTLMLAIGSAICLLVLIGSTILLCATGHAKMALVLAGYGVLWIFSGYDRERMARKQSNDSDSSPQNGSPG